MIVKTHCQRQRHVTLTSSISWDQPDAWEGFGFLLVYLNTLSTTDVMTFFVSKRDVYLYVCERSVLNKKPFVVVRSDNKRFVVQCCYGCNFHLSFFRQVDGCFHLVEERDHTCTELFPCIKKVRVCQKTRDLIDKYGKMTVTEVKNWLLETYGIHAETTMLCRAITQVRHEALGVKLGFGNLTSFLNEVSRNNADSMISIVSPAAFSNAHFLPSGCAYTLSNTQHAFWVWTPATSRRHTGECFSS